MRQLVAFQVADGHAVIAEVDDNEPGIERAARGDDVLVWATGRLEEALEHVRTVAELTLGKLRGLSAQPETVEVEFGIRLNAEAGAVIARTLAEGHLQVTLTWTNSSASADA